VSARMAFWPAIAGGVPRGGIPTVFVGMYAPQGRYNVGVSELKHYYGLNHLHYLTNSTYRRASVS
jgi:hypothetical protein